MSVEKTKVREEFNTDCLVRDEFRCRACGLHYNEGKLDVHHITARENMPYGGYVKENGITLCEATCHPAAERFLKRRARPGFEGGLEGNRFALSEANLYKLIESSYEQALEACSRLKGRGE